MPIFYPPPQPTQGRRSVFPTLWPTDTPPLGVPAPSLWTILNTWQLGPFPLQRSKGFPQAAAGFTIAVAQVTETDFAQVIAWAPKRRLVVQVLETDFAQGLGRLKTRLIGQVTEANTAQAVAVAPQRRLVVQVTETNLAQAITALLAGAGAFLQTVRQDLANRFRQGR